MPAQCKSAVQRNGLHARFLSKLIILKTQLFLPGPSCTNYALLKLYCTVQLQYIELVLALGVLLTSKLGFMGGPFAFSE
jgi:hypothetical protein